MTNFCLQYLRNDNDHTICNGQYYWLDGVWATLFPFIGAIIAWAGSCKRTAEEFTVLYRIQATFSTIGMIAALGWMGWDIFVLIEYGSRLKAFCADIFYIWMAEIIFVFSKITQDQDQSHDSSFQLSGLMPLLHRRASAAVALLVARTTQSIRWTWWSSQLKNPKSMSKLPQLKLQTAWTQNKVPI